MRSNRDDRVQGFKRNFEIPSVWDGDYNGTSSGQESVIIPAINDLRNVNQMGQVKVKALDELCGTRIPSRTFYWSNSHPPTGAASMMISTHYYRA